MKRYTIAEIWNKFCAEEAENHDAKAYFGYSGRCMYGRRVMGITCGANTAFTVMQRLGQYVNRHGLDDTVDLKQDSMRRSDVILYPDDSDYYLDESELDALRLEYGDVDEEEEEEEEE